MKSIKASKTEHPNQKVKRTRQDLFWHFASLWLEALNFTEIKDEGFKDLYDELCSYVSEKLDRNISGEITDMYMVVEHKTEK